MRGLSRNFRICDRDRTGGLDLDELAKCCSLCRLGLSEAEVATLYSNVRDRPRRAPGAAQAQQSAQYGPTPLARASDAA